MMSWFRKRKEQNRQNWSIQEARKRQELSASVEESLVDPAFQAEQWLDEIEEEEEVAQVNKTSVIPPRLRLQSKVLPVIHPGLRGDVEADPVQTANAPTAHETGQIPRSEATPLARGNQRLSRTTKVRLQVVPKSQTLPAPSHRDTGANALDPTTSLDLSVVSSSANSPDSARVDVKNGMKGRGNCASGQSEVGVVNARITSDSVVVVMLASDPGPVVVQYVSLQPHYGFTVHLSAPAVHDTSFTYAILEGN